MEHKFLEKRLISLLHKYLVNKTQKILSGLIYNYLNNNISDKQALNMLSLIIDPESIFYIDDEFLTDSFFALYHLNEGKFSTPRIVFEYLDDCYRGARKYNSKERDSYILGNRK